MWKFIQSSSKKANWFDHAGFEVCFVGRSNVGKSSLINALANQKIARTSNTPGRTQLINFFEFNQKVLVDLPGYGFAKMPQAQLRKMALMTEEYFQERIQLFCTFVLIDAKVGVTNEDREMFDFLKQTNKKMIVIMTKVDKATQQQKVQTERQVCAYTDDYVLTSSLKGKNISKVRKIILAII